MTNSPIGQSTPDESNMLAQINSDFTAEWESLIRKVIESGGYEKVDLGPVQFDSGEIVNQELFVQPGFSVPEVGIALLKESERLEYSCKCFRGSPQGYGSLIVAQPHMTIVGTTNVSAPANVMGDRALALSIRYDEAICKALVRAYGERVLHSVEVGYGNSPAKTSYLERGYKTRDGYPQVVERIYEPDK